MKRAGILGFVPLVIFAAIVTALAISLYATGDSRFATHIGDQAPATELPALNGKQFSAAAEKGRPYILNVFASWCAPCRAEQPDLLGLQQAGARIVGVAYEDKPDAVRIFLKQEGNPFAIVALDAQGRTGIDWGITGVPETFLIDAQGVIRFHQAGPLTDEADQKLLALWTGASK